MRKLEILAGAFEDAEGVYQPELLLQGGGELTRIWRSELTFSSVGSAEVFAMSKLQVVLSDLCNQRQSPEREKE